MAEPEPTAEQLAEQIRALKIADLVLSTVSTLGQLTYVKIEANELDDARLAIDAIAALVPLLEGHADAQVLRDFNQLLANVRLSYASAASRGQTPSPAPSGQEAPGAERDEPAPDRPEPAASDEERGQTPGHDEKGGGGDG